MEDTLRGYGNNDNQFSRDCLNPCFNGRYSQRDMGTMTINLAEMS